MYFCILPPPDRAPPANSLAPPKECEQAVFLYYVIILNMVKVGYQNIPDELKDLSSKSFMQRDRFVTGSVQSQRSLLSKNKRRELSRVAQINSPQSGRGSMLRFLSPKWRELSDLDREKWRIASEASKLNPWQLFVSDSAARFRNYLDLGATPSPLWQVRTGRIILNPPAKKILLKQEHPLDYWITSRVRGKWWKQELKLLREYFALPLTLKIRYKSDFIVAGDNPFVKYYAIVKTSYQGVDRINKIEINMSLNSDWTFAEVSLTGVVGYVIYYTLFLECNDVQGSVLVDNLRCEHSGQNWLRDPRCDDVSKIFNKQFKIVKPYWEEVEKPSGALWLSVYPPAL